jgi:hypothetical protein
MYDRLQPRPYMFLALGKKLEAERLRLWVLNHNRKTKVKLRASHEYACAAGEKAGHLSKENNRLSEENGRLKVLAAFLFIAVIVVLFFW